MGHGYLAVLGYGILVDLQSLIEVFPELFHDDDDGLDHDAVEDFATDHRIGIYYERQHDDSDEPVFITSRNAPMVDARSGDHEVITKTHLAIDESVKNFASNHFPEKKLQLYLYSYQDA